MGAKSIKSDNVGKHNNLTKKPNIIIDIVKFQKIMFWLVIILLIFPVVTALENPEENFRNRNGKEWNVKAASNGLIMYAYRLRPEEKGQPLSREQAIETVKKFLDDNSDILGLGNWNYRYDELAETEYLSYWRIDFNGDILTGLIPPHTYYRTFVTRDGQVYAIGDIDFYNEENIELFQRDTIPETKAIEEAKKSIGSNTKPVETKLMTNIKINNSDYTFIWDIKFGDPDNKEVLVDAKTGEILSTKSIKNPLKLGALGQLLSNPFVMIALSLVVIGIIFITFFFIERIRKVREKEGEENQLLLKN
jgi:hypothetical protein